MNGVRLFTIWAPDH